MYLLFLTTRIIFIVLGIGFLAIASVVDTIPGWMGVGIYLSLGVAFTVLAMINEMFATKKFDSIISKTLCKCKTQECIKILEQLRKKKVVVYKGKKAVLIALLKAYFDLGDYDSVKVALEDYRIGIKPDSVEELLYLDHLFFYYMMTNDIDNASIIYSEYETKMDCKMSADVRKIISKEHTAQKFQILMSEKNFNEAEKFYLESYETIQFLNKKVYHSYILGLIALHYHKLNDAIKAFEFVTDNGGDTCYVQYAQEHLNQIKISH